MQHPQVARLETATPERPIALGRYDVVGRLGRGGMGTVYDAIDRERGTRVALKTLLAADAAGGVQLKREFRTVSELAHPNLAPVYELSCEEGLWFFTMERIDGTDLRRWARGDTVEPRTPVAEEPPTREEDPSGEESAPVSHAIAGTRASAPARPLAELRRAFVEIARGLTALHDAGLWHGDVKPGNVLVRNDGRVVVVDFGLARPVGDAKRVRGPTSGTPVYMAPEQLMGEDVGPSSDWYAVGTMLYELLTGRLPFGRAGDATLVELYIRKTLQTPPSPRDLLSAIPEDLSELCMLLLRTDPALRPSRDELLATLAGDGAKAAPIERPRVRSQFVGRERELEKLAKAYERARSGRCVVVHTHGPSGIGKSAVVRTFLAGALAVDGAEIFRGRCFERESVPYKAFDGIVDELATRLVELGPSIETILPAWIGELAQVFPALGSVPAIARRARIPAATDAKELRRRSWTALRQLLEVMGQERTVVLWIDDLQWADADSAGLLESLVRDARRMPLLVVASYRSTEATQSDVLGGYFEGTRSRTDDVVDLPIGALSRREAEQLARAMLEGLTSGPANVSGTKNLADEAAGVPLFIEELARYVASAGAGAHVSLEDALAARIRALPDRERALVEIVSVAGSRVAQSVLFEAAGLATDGEALTSLVALRNASLVSWTGAAPDDLVYAYHDRIRESVSAALDTNARHARHLALARAFVKRYGDDEGAGDAWVFDTIRHFGAAADAMNDPAERLAAARLHLRAGRAARASAAFPLASECFEGGIRLLGSDAWSREYELALALHVGAAETAYLSAEWDRLAIRVADVKKHGRSAMDQLLAWEVEIDALVGRHDYAGAVEAGLQVLGLLDVHLPSHPEPADLEKAVRLALDTLTRVGPEGLAALPDVDDPRVAAAMRVQVRVSPAAYFGRPLLLPLIAANLINTSVDRGLSYATPYALALFGIVLNTMGLFPISHAWGQLAVKLIDRWEDRSLEAATRHVVFNLVCPWMVPLSTILAPLREVFDIGRRIGDLEYASYAAHGYVHNAMYAGRPLAPLVVEAHELGEQMRALGQVNAMHVHAPFERLLACLTGRARDPSSLDGDGFDEAAALAKAAADGSRSGIFVVRIAMGLARFTFGKAREASECFEIARDHADAGPSVWHVPILHQFAALSACAAFSELDANARAALRPRIEASLAELRALAGHCAINFAHRLSMVEGELRRIDGDANGAFARFVEAAEQAREGGWVSDIALARELASRCQSGLNAKRASLETARDEYEAWGAIAKARQLDARIAAL